MADIDPYELERQRLEAQQQAKQAELLAALQGAQQAPQLSGTQAIAQGVLGILPMVLGYAIAKKRGLAAGADAGALASTQYEAKAKEPGKLSQAASLARAKALQSEVTNLQKSNAQVGLAGLNSQAADERLGTQFENSKQMEGIKQTNRESLENKKLEAKKLSPTAQTALNDALAGKDGEMSEADFQELVDKGYLDEIQRANGQGISADKQKRQFEREDAEREIGLLKIVTDKDGKKAVPSKWQSQKANAVAASFLPLENKIAETKTHFEAFKKGDKSISTQTIVTDLSDLIVAIKNAKQMGANFTTLERDLVKAGLPSIDSITKEQFVDNFFKKAQGQDPILALKQLQKRMRTDAEIELATYKYEFGDAETAQTLSNEEFEALKQQFGKR